MQEISGIVVADSAVDLILDFIELLGQRGRRYSAHRDGKSRPRSR